MAWCGASSLADCGIVDIGSSDAIATGPMPSYSNLIISNANLLRSNLPLLLNTYRRACEQTRKQHNRPDKSIGTAAICLLESRGLPHPFVQRT